MDKKEQEILDEIRKRTEDVKVPCSLYPDNVNRMLEEKKQKKRIRPCQIGVLSAACIVAVVGIALWKTSGADVQERTQQASETEINDSKMIASADSYEQIYGYIEDYQKALRESVAGLADVDISYGVTEEIAIEESVTDSKTSNTSSSTGSAAELAAETASDTGDYSQTNVRQDGVDEGDTIKTDGTYLYVLKENGREVVIVDTREQKLTKLSSVEVGKDDYIYEIYVLSSQKKLVLVCSSYGQSAEEEVPEAEEESSMGDSEVMELSDGNWNREVSVAVTYDISDPEHPAEEGRVQQSGNYSSSRIADGYLYLFSDYYIWSEVCEDAPRTYVPLVDGELMGEDCIYLPQVSQGNMYEVITSIDLEKPDETKDSKAIFSKGGQLYVSNNHIYFYETEWLDGEKCTTTIRKVAYENGELTAKAQGQFNGYLKDSFSIDEYDGYLRVVTTQGDTNSVYVLDAELDTVGAIEGLAEEERVYSARFMGDVGYFVTFRETDPLFSVDLSDPKNPEIAGELKIPGFSDYLHFYGEDQLLGIGMSVDEETMTTDGVKLSMFDISDKTDVKEVNTYILENVYGTDVSYDYKAVLVDVNRNMIGFSGYGEGKDMYYIFSYDEKDGFICKMAEEINGGGGNSRGIYIEDTLYVVQGNIIEAYSLKDYQKVDDLVL